jgi:ketosteroid isomerase-like protein
MQRIVTLIAAGLLTSACQPQPAAPDPRVAALADRQAIDQLIAGDYPRALDTQDWEAYADAFTADGELSLQGQSAKGRAGIIRFVGALPAEPKVIHIITNLSYDIQGDTATGGAYWQDIGMEGNAPGVLVAGHYEDTLRKVGGQWKIAKRAIVIEFIPAAPAALPTQ